MKRKHLIAVMTVVLMGFTKPGSGNLTINLTDIESKEGEIVFMLFAKEDGFPKEPSKAFKKGVVTDFSASASYTFKKVPYGTYAVSVFQDKDKNGEIKSNFIGMPKEPVGASNMTKMGKPSFKKCSFQLNSQNKELRMKFIIN
ncbi:DUF2141 domain-containing protein [Ulvibacterium marinum]|uniref:DUF2141 domain-containing protein n=1 Tax=Ulvibacterium marinum TaxID=2419782 RepID=A0A3B0BWR4_9FLAO|nr:DUF2141 domain-containing protein [Ulvibacterium marinum]RKN76748.1 DUF2141 domain-containing protein [Ulvibacterium marinum]